MDITEARNQYARYVATVNGVLDRYMSRHACPCHWEQFEYWVSKSQSQGWQDNIQNELIEAALSLPCFSVHRTRPRPSDPDFLVTCSVCGEKWFYSSEEWRMGAFHDRLTPLVTKPNLNEKYGQRVGESIFATVGYSPEDAQILSSKEWAEFMLGEPYTTEDTPSLSVAVNPHSDSILQRITNWFIART